MVLGEGAVRGSAPAVVYNTILAPDAPVVPTRHERAVQRDRPGLSGGGRTLTLVASVAVPPSLPAPDPVRNPDPATPRPAPGASAFPGPFGGAVALAISIFGLIEIAILLLLLP